MNADYQEVRDEAMEALAEDRPRDAFVTLRPVLRYGFEFDSQEQFRDAFGLFAILSRAIAGDELSDQVEALLADPTNVEKHFQLGHALIEHSLPGVAATVLHRANQIHPGISGIVSELVTALEEDGNTLAAVQVLEEVPDLMQGDFLLGYLHAFNALLSGDIDKSANTATGLQPEDNDHHRHMMRTLREMHRRADLVRDTTPLDSTDLRGWHYVITGSLLTHLSPHGFPEPMNGRYAFINDTLENCRGGIALLQRLLDRKRIAVERIFALPDRDSEIMARATASVLNVPLTRFEKDESRSGLIVSYTPAKHDRELLEMVRQHRPGQILFAHAIPWTELSPLVGDVVTLLYQQLIAPWQPGFVMGDDDQLQETPADDRDASAIADEIATADIGEGFGEDLLIGDQLDRLADAIQLPCGEGTRSLMWENSPVKSSRFL